MSHHVTHCNRSEELAMLAVSNLLHVNLAEDILTDVFSLSLQDREGFREEIGGALSW
jgi:hypothetical protein